VLLFGIDRLRGLLLYVNYLGTGASMSAGKFFVVRARCFCLCLWGCFGLGWCFLVCFFCFCVRVNVGLGEVSCCHV